MNVKERNTLLIRAAFILLVILVAIYIPLKLYIARSEEDQKENRLLGRKLSILVTSELRGDWKPCG